MFGTFLLRSIFVFHCSFWAKYKSDIEIILLWWHKVAIFSGISSKASIPRLFTSSCHKNSHKYKPSICRSICRFVSTLLTVNPRIPRHIHHRIAYALDKCKISQNHGQSTTLSTNFSPSFPAYCLERRKMQMIGGNWFPQDAIFFYTNYILRVPIGFGQIYQKLCKQQIAFQFLCPCLAHGIIPWHSRKSRNRNWVILRNRNFSKFLEY